MIPVCYLSHNLICWTNLESVDGDSARTTMGQMDANKLFLTEDQLLKSENWIKVARGLRELADEVEGDLRE